MITPTFLRFMQSHPVPGTRFVLVKHGTPVEDIDEHSSMVGPSDNQSTSATSPATPD